MSLPSHLQASTLRNQAPFSICLLHHNIVFVESSPPLCHFEGFSHKKFNEMTLNNRLVTWTAHKHTLDVKQFFSSALPFTSICSGMDGWPTFLVPPRDGFSSFMSFFHETRFVLLLWLPSRLRNVHDKTSDEHYFLLSLDLPFLVWMSSSCEENLPAYLMRNRERLVWQIGCCVCR